MNQERRKRIRSLILDLKELRGQVEDLVDEEAESIANMEEYFPDSPKITDMEEAQQSLEDVQGFLEDAISSLEEI